MSFLKKMGKELKKAVGDLGDSLDKGPGSYGDMERSNSVSGEGSTFLHGYLIIHVNEARNIPDMENWYSKIVNSKDVSDPFVDVKLGKCRIAKTKVIDNSLNPQWRESFKVEVCHKADSLIFDVRDKDHAYTEVIGIVDVPCHDLINGQVIEGWRPITKGSKMSGELGELNFRVEYVSMMQINQSYDVDSYFRMHRGCHVTLYQDVKVPDNLPYFNMVKGPHDAPLQTHSCWRDLYDSIVEARHMICITGWSVWTELRLFRGEDAVRIYDGTLGQLLCRKANQGVQVKVMVWSEYTSGNLKTEGVMGTHDMETYNYFKDGRNYENPGGNKVICALAPREVSSTREMTDHLQHVFSSGAYTHHQKTVICDADDPYSQDGRRRLVAFVGGLDLTGGRYDTPEFELFSTLKQEHLGDFRNSNAKGQTTEHIGPREPWHDIHSKVEGPIARDVLLNFIERWQKQGTKEAQAPAIDEYFLNIINPDSVASHRDPNKEWNVQVFRSITSDSAVFDRQREAVNPFILNGKKGKKVDSSISQAYIQTIRGAQNFIYIENQYFMGSAYEWSDDSSVLCNHTIPAEITAKIRNKIAAGERFTAYIVIPMWPEGDPTSVPMQAILHWQTNTMKMMYREVGRALRQYNVPPHLGQHPTDWLMFLCPGKRELGGHHMDALDDPVPGTLAEIFRETMRQMIYVHSKMMIVDDAYIIVGSANINERSMAGTRDSEIAVGCWQPNFNAFTPYGDVHMFRMQLWSALLQTWEESFRYPGTLETTQRVKEMSWHNWQCYNYDKYNLDKNDLPPGKLLLYPIQVSHHGEVSNLDMFKSFPDYPETAKVMGGKSGVSLLDKVTT